MACLVNLYLKVGEVGHSVFYVYAGWALMTAEMVVDDISRHHTCNQILDIEL